MFGVVYLILNILLGKEIAGLLLLQGKHKGEKGAVPVWIWLPAAFASGALLMTWAVYLIAWGASVEAGAENPLFWANLAVMGGTTVFLACLYIKRKKAGMPVVLPGINRCLRGEVIFFFLIVVFVTWMMFYTFHVSNGYLYSGFTVYGDYAPHTAMMRSFSWGNNFPTQYPHFGGEDVKYHFMFQFFAGNLEYLGMRIDLAYNSVSILSLAGFFMVLYILAKRIVGSFGAGVLTVVFTVFRSGTAFFRFAWEHLKEGNLWQTLAENTSFIGYTPNENWGLWNFNVYLNQRHLAFGLILIGLAVWVFMDWLEAGAAHEETGLHYMKDRLFTKQAWKCRNLETALLMGLLLGLSSFWNGAAVIGGLLILCGMAVFSDGKLDYAVMAAVTIAFSMIQTKIFIYGSVVEPSFYFGLLAEEKTLTGVLWYLTQVSGFFFTGLLLLVFALKRRERIVMAGFLLPAVFAFLVSLTPDVNVNHKYVMISYAFLAMFWAWAVVALWKRKLLGKILAAVLVVCLTATGIYDFVVILKDNDSGHRIGVNLESGLSKWLGENLEKDDLVLTPEYSINEVTMSGAMMYLGWPYYAWSAGYDTYYRAEKAVEIYTTDSRETLEKTVAQENISYIIYEEGMEFEQHECREDIIRETYPQVYSSEDGRIRIYETGRDTADGE